MLMANRKFHLNRIVMICIMAIVYSHSQTIKNDLVTSPPVVYRYNNSPTFLICEFEGYENMGSFSWMRDGLPANWVEVMHFNRLPIDPLDRLEDGSVQLMWYLNEFAEPNRNIDGYYVCSFTRQTTQLVSSSIRVVTVSYLEAPSNPRVECISQTPEARISWDSNIEIVRIPSFIIKVASSENLQLRGHPPLRNVESDDTTYKMWLLKEANFQAMKENWETIQNFSDIVIKTVSPRSTHGRFHVTYKLKPDNVYYFRIHTQLFGIQSPSTPNLPSLLNSEFCHTVVEPISFQPAYINVYGTSDGTLIINWQHQPIKDVAYSQQEYHITVKCEDCVKYVHWEPFTTRKSTIILHANDDRFHLDRDRFIAQIETFRRFSVTLWKVVNGVPGTVHKAVGYSGEGIPTVPIVNLLVSDIASTTAIISWDAIDDATLRRNSNGYFIGFRVHWCQYNEMEKICSEDSSYYQDFNVRNIPDEFKVELRRLAIGDRLSNTNLVAKNTPVVSRRNRVYATLTGLKPDSTIRATAHVINMLNEGISSEPKIFQTLKPVPKLEVASVKDKSVILKWEAVEEADECKISVTRDEDGEPIDPLPNVCSLAESPPFAMLGDFLPNTEYLITVKLYFRTTLKWASAIPVRTRKFALEIPETPQNLTVQCLQFDQKTSVAVLRWNVESQSMEAPDYVIEWTAGYNRSGFEVVRNRSPLNDDEALKQLWISEHLRAARDAAKAQVLAGNWRSAKQSDIILLEHGHGQMLQAVVQLYPDLAYHFRVRSNKNNILSDASNIAPTVEFNSLDMCYTPPGPIQFLPKILAIYGTRPDNLFIRWTPLSHLLHGGPGLRYVVKYICADCPSPISDSIEVDENICQIAISSSPGQWDSSFTKHVNGEIASFTKYKVTLTISNAFGSQTLNGEGNSGERIPSHLLDAPAVIWSTDDVLLLKWKVPQMQLIEMNINGFFRGYRVYWCTHINECESLTTFQDFVDSKLSKNPLAHYRHLSTSSCLAPNEVNQKLRPVSETNPLLLHDGEYYAIVSQLPANVPLKVAVSLLNAQYAGDVRKFADFRTPKPISFYQVNMVGSRFAMISWKQVEQHRYTFLMDIIEVSDSIDTDGMTFAMKSFQLGTPEEDFAFITGLESNRQYRIALRLTAGNLTVFGSTLELRTSVNFTSGQTLTPVLVKPVGFEINAVSVCLPGTLVTFDESLRRSYSKMGTFSLTESNMWVTYSEVRLNGTDTWSPRRYFTEPDCQLYENLNETALYEVRVTFADLSGNMWTSISTIFNATEVNKPDAESRRLVILFSTTIVQIYLKVSHASFATALFSIVIILVLAFIRMKKENSAMTIAKSCRMLNVKSVVLQNLEHPLQYFESHDSECIH